MREMRMMTPIEVETAKILPREMWLRVRQLLKADELKAEYADQLARHREGMTPEQLARDVIRENYFQLMG